jgi:hypothetical protein
VGQFCAFGGEGFVVEALGGLRIEREAELVFPAELEAGLAQCVVTDFRAGVALGEVGGAYVV